MQNLSVMTCHSYGHKSTITTNHATMLFTAHILQLGLANTCLGSGS